MISFMALSCFFNFNFIKEFRLRRGFVFLVKAMTGAFDLGLVLGAGLGTEIRVNLGRAGLLAFAFAVAFLGNNQCIYFNPLFYVSLIHPSKVLVTDFMGLGKGGSTCLEPRRNPGKQRPCLLMRIFEQDRNLSVHLFPILVRGMR